MITSNIFLPLMRFGIIKFKTLLLFFGVFYAFNSMADNFDNGYFRYRILEQTSNVVVDWLIEENLDTNPVSELNIPPTVEHKGKTYTVVAVAHSAWIIQRNEISSIKLPKTINQVVPHIPWAKKDLKKIIVDEDNPYYASIDGILYNKDASKLIICPPGKTEVDVPESVSEIGEYAFTEGRLRSINLPEGLNIIEKNAFFGCDKLESIELPPSLTSVGNYAFQGCSALQSVSIPSLLGKFLAGTFFGCHNLRTFIVDEANEVMTAEGPCLFNKNKTVLLLYPSASGDVIIPDGVKETGYNLFAYNNEIVSVTFPASIENVGQGTCRACDEIKWVKFYSVVPPVIEVDAMENGFITSSEDPYLEKYNITLYVPAESFDLYKKAKYFRSHVIKPFETDSGISVVKADGHFMVYSIEGYPLLSTSDIEDLDTLPRGLYIVNGKKMFIGR